MLCPNCDYEMEHEMMCPNCGVNPVLYTKTVHMSDTLYNRGLAQAKTNDLSTAIDSLTKSIEFNKNNIEARNLLGLVHFEMGHIGDALKQWVISGSLLRENNLAVYYLDLIQNNSRSLEKINDTVKMYNNALEYLRQKSDDMAIIQLKKAIEINPKFVDAMNLLTLCYLIQKDKEKAKALTERVLSIDINNRIALQYYKELFPTKIRPEPVYKIKKGAAQAQQPAFASLQPKDRKSFGETFHISEMLSFIIGAGCAFAILYILVMPGLLDAKDKEISQLKVDAIEAENQYATASSLNTQKTNELEALNVKLDQDNKVLLRQLSLLEKTNKIQAAESLAGEEKYEEAADILRDMVLSDLPADVVRTANELRAEVYPIAAKRYHENGVLKYDTGDHEEAKALLDKCLIYAQVDVDYMDSVIFYMGRIAEDEDNIAEAKSNYERIINDYPSSSFKTRANNRLNALPQE